MRQILTLSGQGSQYYQMGHSLYQHNAVFKYWLDVCDNYLAKLGYGHFIPNLYDRNKKIFDPIHNIFLSHPSLFCVQYAAAKAVLEHTSIDFIFGFSLGEYVAMTLAEIVSLESMIECIYQQALLFDQLEATMKIIVARASVREIENALRNNRYEISMIASSKSCTITIPKEEAQKLYSYLQKHQISYVEAPFYIPFHTRWISPYQETVISTLPKYFTFTKKQFLSCSQNSFCTILTPENLWEIIQQKIDLPKLFNLFFSPNDMIIDISPNQFIYNVVRMNFDSHALIAKKSKYLMSQFQSSS